ncbi:hypothetical protein ABGN05_14105 [Aquibium sp. LZ166]|uniref:EAL domain-containing protein n=1 Tax=Aquibium pacificus TaxID=3153579 RepID=A0ABV3SJ72_9HYPH
MRFAKEATATFSGEHHRLSSRLTSAGIVGNVFDAMDEDRLKLYSREARDLSDPDRSSARVEILVRLLDRNCRLSSPADFVPAAERFVRAALLDRLIAWTALERHGSAVRTGMLSLRFNPSARTLSDPDL